MSSMGWPDDGMDGPDWSFLGSDPGASQPPTGIIPTPSSIYQPASIIPTPPQDQSAVFVPLSAYGPPPVLQDPNANLPPPSGTPSARAVGDALGAAGYFPDGAVSAARIVTRDKGLAKAFANTSPYFDGPLAVGSSVANTIADLSQGASPADAIVGNIIRGGLVYGAGWAGTAATPFGAGGIPAALVADHYLPPAPQIGHVAVGILGPLQSYDPAYDPVAF
jgi:hypothetical protein